MTATNPLYAIQARADAAMTALADYGDGKRGVMSTMIRLTDAAEDAGKLVAAIRAVEAVEYPAVPDDFVYEMSYNDALKAVREAIREALG